MCNTCDALAIVSLQQAAPLAPSLPKKPVTCSTAPVGDASKCKQHLHLQGTGAHGVG